ncbi:MAG: transketolase [Epsilonproteobacteria bacterium]|nr:transketolase [Campylobacterota bacterium]OIO15386.1 MAG: transketolase [Helicobacteraceae bacterium CG1_02_36_14]PIP10291.1 MAG: transketolase [Sulfurimonas sp. CG23_combo_of_CG06-09_8_20_14_all_36_33]PIS26390.1 MAG: transketolase [Sulfurimonas sp. CG08_land_8_20_14_0_20_36_33]PIU33852.1 MAG: transketolase [Sulfurimonas sp. CG07_land_8_20_14_0_80_36_56]PIV03680.1 MAG: transketolase [Sulfurimonas sp. CG03_land_8_20_14_0_80_36_25]PIV34177.1 MAG: transketolase [Sulfurimonas sp. CG02_land_8_2
MSNVMRQKMANTIRFLAADMVQAANSGHPGAPMGLADIAVVLSEHLNHNPKNPSWLNRDRLVFSGGHATGLIYALYYLWGYGLEVEDLKNFRQLDSKTPGHPEFGHTAGIEITTGPLGQGIANAVGFSMASKFVGAQVNSETAELIDHNVYCLCGDGDLEEGISYEACSIAGHNKLDNLILIYDSNRITIEGSTDLSISENIRMRFESQAWDVLECDGHDFDAIDAALTTAKTNKKPTLIIANTVIAKGAGKLEGSHHAHGAPLGAEIIAEAKLACGFDANKSFQVDEDVMIRFRCAIEKGDFLEREWIHRQKTVPLMEQNEALIALENHDFSRIEYPTFDKADATRNTNGKIMNAIARAVPSFLGGSADLSPSNKTNLENMGVYPKGRNIYFGIREHAMASITNAIALYGPLLPFSATFFVFSDYLKPAARIAALTGIQQFFIWTHDSIGVGEDGPTHQPIEHLSQFRSLPNFYVWRPADGAENVEAWKTALTMRKSPSAFVCSRQNLALLPHAKKGSASQGGYLLASDEAATITLMASGSEVELALKVKEALSAKGEKVNVVSVPCYDLFIEQEESYIDSIIKPETKKVAIEAARGLEWYKLADRVIGMDSFGASAPAEELFDKFGFTVENILQKIK